MRNLSDYTRKAKAFVKGTANSIARSPGKIALGALILLTGCGATSKVGLENKVHKEPKLDSDYLMSSPRFDREYIEGQNYVYFVDSSVQPFIREMATGNKNTFDLGKGKTLIYGTSGLMSEEEEKAYHKLILKADTNNDRAVTVSEYKALEASSNK
jgi:hypothetical protein